jgi:hypothetical protein
MNAEIRNFQATSYSGAFTARDGQIKLEGNITTDPEKKITDIDGIITNDGTMMGRFRAYMSGGELLYNISDAKISYFGTIIDSVSDALDAIDEQIKNE